jgi:hypothetical protein
MNASELTKLQSLATHWRARADEIESKYESMNPSQTKLVSENYRERAEDLEIVIKEFKNE